MKRRLETQQPRYLRFLTILTGLILAGIGALLIPRAVQRDWSSGEATLTMAGLAAPVTVVRDADGVPHLYGGNERDLAFAQGYVHAQDRFWQMELNRRRGQGTLTALLGTTASKQDRQWQALNLPSLAEQALAGMDPQNRVLLDAYAQGVNAWLEGRQSHLPLEFTLLRWQGHAVSPPLPWRPLDSYTIALVLAWQMSGPRINPRVAARIEEQMGTAGAALLLGEAYSSPTRPKAFSAVASGAPTGSLPATWPLAGRVTCSYNDGPDQEPSLLAIDLPWGLELPSPWYVMARHTGDVSTAGVSIPGLPGLLVESRDAGLLLQWLETGERPPSAGLSPWKSELLRALLQRRETNQSCTTTAATVQEFQTQLFSTFSPHARRLISLLITVEPQGWLQERTTEMLKQWDYDLSDNSPSAVVFAAYQLELARAAFADELGPELFQAYTARTDHYQVALDKILQDPASPWWDDVSTPERESRADILKKAYAPALDWIGRRYGDLHLIWEWNQLHGNQLRHVLGQSWPWDTFLNQDFTPGGWTYTTNPSPGGLPAPDLASPQSTPDNDLQWREQLYPVKAVYGYRQIIDLRDPATTWFILLPGQSGHPFHPNYNNLIDDWSAGHYHPLLLVPSPEQVPGAASRLRLAPKD